MNKEPIGQVLQEARINLGKSIKEVEFDTKIRAKYIEALEDDNFDSLPSNIYTQGFLKTYANYLGMNPEPLVQQYKSLYGTDSSSDLTQISANIRVKTKKRPIWFKPIIAFGSVAAVFIILIAWGAYVQNASKEKNVVIQDIKARGNTPTTVAATTTSTDARKGFKDGSDLSNSSGDGNSTIGDGKIDVIVKLIGINGTGSWVRVSVDDTKKYEGVIPAGGSKVFQGDESIRIRVGNLTGLEILYNGKKVRSSEMKTVNGIADRTFKASNKSKSSRSTTTSESKNGQR